MYADIHQLGIDVWSVEDRLRLIDEIWDSLDHQGEWEVPESHREELDRRIEEADANPGGGAPAEEVLARLRKKE